MGGETDPLDWGRVLRQAVVPVASAYAGLLLVLLRYRRDPVRDDRAGAAPGRLPGYGRLVRYLLATAAGGYAVFLLIVAVFYLVLGGQPASLLREALVEGSWFAFGVVVPGLVLLTWLHDRGRRR